MSHSNDNNQSLTTDHVFHRQSSRSPSGSGTSSGPINPRGEEPEPAEEQHGLELHSMARADEDEEDYGGATAPLLQERGRGASPRRVSLGEERGEISGRERLPSTSGLGTGFIWALALSAGISGLLFGYEYVTRCFYGLMSLLLSGYCSC